MNTRELRQHLASGGAALFDLGTRAKFQLTGADRVRYLNGQVSNDVRRIAPGSAMPACVMTAKGKMNALVWISAKADTLQLDADPELRETLAARLERYIISDDVTLNDITDDYGLVHFLGTSVEPSGETLPEGFFRSRRFGFDGMDRLLPKGSHIRHVSSTGENDTLTVDPETLETFRIEQGIPRWGFELTENTLPAEAGLDTSAIDFHKGCYIGQEVISRIKSVGHVNRHLAGFVAETPLAAGTPLFDGEKEVGLLTSAAWSFALEKGIALGYLKRGTDATHLAARPAAGSPVEVQIHALPFL